MICHYYIPLFTDTTNYHKVEKIVNIICDFITVIDKLTDQFNLSDLENIELELFKVLYRYQEIVTTKKATPNFHIATDMVLNCLMYGPLAHNSAFIGEGLNFTLSKPFVCSNSSRYSIMFFDMT